MSPRRASGVAALATGLWRRRPGRSDLPRLAAPDRVQRVLIVKVHDQLGDFLLATPTIRALREHYAGATLALATRAFLAPLAGRNPHLDRMWVIPRLDGARAAGRLAAVLGAVAAFRPDLAVVLNSVSRSRTADLLAVLSRARIVAGRSAVVAGPLPGDAPSDPFAAAVSSPRDTVYDLDLPIGRGSDHQVDRYLDLVRWTGARPSSCSLVLELGPEERGRGREMLREILRGASQVRRVGLHPGAANPLKCWPLESFVELGVAVARGAADERHEVALAVFDSPRERGRAAAVCAGLAARGVQAGFVPAAGIETFAAVCAALDLLVCNDSGVMHIAASLGVPTISFHSLGRPAEWAPRGPQSVALHAPRGIEAIPVAAAAEAARILLRSPA